MLQFANHSRSGKNELESFSVDDDLLDKQVGCHLPRSTDCRWEGTVVVTWKRRFSIGKNQERQSLVARKIIRDHKRSLDFEDRHPKGSKSPQMLFWFLPFFPSFSHSTPFLSKQKVENQNKQSSVAR